MPGVAVEQRDAEEEERRGERAEQEVLERRLLREQAAAAGEAAEQVERERQDLERDEHRQQVVRGREHQHAADREHQPAGRPRSASMPAAAAASLVRCRAARAPGRRTLRPARGTRSATSEHADQRQHQDRALQEQGRPVDGERAAGGRRSACRRRPAATTATQRRDQADEREHELRDVAPAAAARTPRPGRRDGDAEHDDDRRSCAVRRFRRATNVDRGADRRARITRRLLVGGSATAGLGSVHADLLQGRGDRRVDHVEQRLREEPERDDQRDQRRHHAAPRAAQVGSCPRPSAPGRSSCAGTSAGRTARRARCRGWRSRRDL